MSDGHLDDPQPPPNSPSSDRVEVAVVVDDAANHAGGRDGTVNQVRVELTQMSDASTSIRASIDDDAGIAALDREIFLHARDVEMLDEGGSVSQCLLIRVELELVGGPVFARPQLRAKRVTRALRSRSALK